jgi:hypothetical protein
MAKKNKKMQLYDIPQASDTPIMEQSKQEVEEQKPAATATPSAETTAETPATTEVKEETAASPLTPLYDRVTAKQAEAQAAQERANALVEAFKKADGEGRAMLLNILKEAEPKKDEDEEKRLRTLAKVQAWGDMLGALTSGVVANTGRYGKGYIPYLPSGSALSSIDKINEMQDEYAKRKLEWDGNMLNFRLGQEQAKIDAAKALATAAQSDADAKAKEADDAYADALDAADRWTRLGIEEEGRNARNAANIAARERVAYINAMNKGKGGSGKDEEDEDALFLGWYDILEPWEPQDIESWTEEYDMRGNADGKKKTITKSKYKDDLPDRERDAKRNVVLKRAKVLYDTGDFTKEEALMIAVGENLEAKGLPVEDIQRVLKYMQQGYDYKRAVAMVVKRHNL